MEPLQLENSDSVHRKSIPYYLGVLCRIALLLIAVGIIALFSFLILYTILYLFIRAPSISPSASESGFWLIKNLDLYNSRLRPEGGPTQIKIGLDNVHFHLTWESKLELNFILSSEWNDNRLNFGEDFSENGKYLTLLNMKRIHMDESKFPFASDFNRKEKSSKSLKRGWPEFIPWIPEILIAGGKITNANQGVDLFLSSTGNVFLEELKQIEIFPLDNDDKIKSFRLDIIGKTHYDHEVQLSWRDHPIAINIFEMGEKTFKLFDGEMLTYKAKNFKYFNKTLTTCQREGLRWEEKNEIQNQCLRAIFTFIDLESPRGGFKSPYGT